MSIVENNEPSKYHTYCYLISCQIKGIFLNRLQLIRSSEKEMKRTWTQLFKTMIKSTVNRDETMTSIQFHKS